MVRLLEEFVEIFGIVINDEVGCEGQVMSALQCQLVQEVWRSSIPLTS